MSLGDRQRATLASELAQVQKSNGKNLALDDKNLALDESNLRGSCKKGFISVSVIMKIGGGRRSPLLTGRPTKLPTGLERFKPTDPLAATKIWKISGAIA